MSRFVFDSSAILAMLRGEPGADLVRISMPGGSISSVNLAEIVTKLVERGASEDIIRNSLALIDLEVAPFTESQAKICGELRLPTRSRGLSLGDRACLALARERGLHALTADAAWVGACDVQVALIR